MPAKWLGNVRIPPQTMRDLSDEEWLKALRSQYGESRVHIGEPQEGGGHSAGYWEARGMVGLYLDEEEPSSDSSEERKSDTE